MHPLFPWKIGRASFAVRNAVMNFFLWPLIPLSEIGPTGDGLVNPVPVWLLALGLLTLWVFGVALPRCRDAGLRWWILVLLVVPLVNSVIAFMLLGTAWRPVVTAVSAHTHSVSENSADCPF